MAGIKFKQPYGKLEKQKKGRKCCGCLSRCCCVKLAAGIVGTIVLILGLVVGIFALSNPIHASCTVHWSFGIPCSDVRTKILDQIQKWNGPAGCVKGGEKCLYKLVSNSGNTLKATHETPKKHYVDDLTFSFDTEGNTCYVQGHSTSETWYAVLDSGTNYCNLENLITGSGLNKAKNYKEQTSNGECTQYSSANCDKY